MNIDGGILWLVVLAACAVAVPMWLALCRRLSWRPARARRALRAAGGLVELIANLQQHRGMSGAWLAGDKSFGARLPEKQIAIGNLFDALETAAREESGEAYPCFRIAEARALRDQWLALADGLASSTPEHSFHTHCQLIAKLLDWLRGLGEARIEQPADGRVGDATVRNFAFRLPALAECLGQARALSSAVAARGQCAPVARVRLLFLLSRAESLLGNSLAATRGLGPPEQTEAMIRSQSFIAAVRKRVLGDEGITITAGECFTLATRAVDAVFAWQAIERRAIELVLDSRAVNPLLGVTGSRSAV